MSDKELSEASDEVVPGTTISEDEWQKIEALVGISKPDAKFRQMFRSRVEFALTQFGPPQFGDVDGPRYRDTRNALKPILAATKKLQQAIAKLDNEARSGTISDKLALAITFDSLRRHLDNALLKMKINTGYEEDEEVVSYVDLLEHSSEVYLEEGVLAALAGLSADCERAITSLGNTKGGAPKNVRRENLIGMLAVTFRQTTGTKPSFKYDPINDIYVGEFFYFADACFDAFASELAPRTDAALAKAIERAEKRMLGI